MTETQQLEGKCVEVSQRGDWVTFHIDIGKQYPVKLATKHDAVVQKVNQLGQNTNAVWSFTEQESQTINEHTGKPYVNRYLNDVEASNVAVAALPGSPAVTDGGDRDRRIVRQTCVKAAFQYGEKFAATLKTDTERHAAEEYLLGLAARLEEWVYRTEAVAVAPEESQEPVEPGVPVDDIPF